MLTVVFLCFLFSLLKFSICLLLSLPHPPIPPPPVPPLSLPPFPPLALKAFSLLMLILGDHLLSRLGSAKDGRVWVGDLVERFGDSPRLQLQPGPLCTLLCSPQTNKLTSHYIISSVYTPLLLMLMILKTCKRKVATVNDMNFKNIQN